MSRTIPPPAHPSAAAQLASLTAIGRPGRAEALAALLHAMQPIQNSTDPKESGAMAQASRTSAPRSNDRAQAASAVRSALRPLLTARTRRAALREAALRAGLQALRPHEIQAITNEELARHLRATRG